MTIRGEGARDGPYFRWPDRMVWLSGQGTNSVREELSAASLAARAGIELVPIWSCERVFLESGQAAAIGSWRAHRYVCPAILWPSDVREVRSPVADPQSLRCGSDNRH